MTTTTEPQRNSMAELALYFLRLGFLGFGGPVALVGQMERELVNDKKWLSKDQMRDPSPSVSRFPDHLLLFIGAGIVGILYYGSIVKRTPAALPGAVVVPATTAPIAPVAMASTLGKLLLFFLKAGSLTFGSGLV